jgi:hypothetical protein
MFEHLTVLLVVALAMLGERARPFSSQWWRASATASCCGSRLAVPQIGGFRDVVDFGLFVVVAAAVGWLVNRLRAAKEQALVAADGERLAREHVIGSSPP